MSQKPSPRDVSPEEYGAAPAAPAKTSDLALYSMIAGVLSYFVFPFVGAIAAIVMGHMATRQIRDSAGALGGRGLAMTGLVLGYFQVVVIPIMVIFALVFFILFASVSRVEVSDDVINVQGPGKTAVKVDGSGDKVRITGPGTRVDVDGDHVSVKGPGGSSMEINGDSKRPRATGKTKKALDDLAQISRALLRYFSHTGKLPGEEGLGALLECPPGVDAKDWKGPYIQELPTDPWGNGYVYSPPKEDGGRFDLYSMGPDGVESKDDLR